MRIYVTTRMPGQPTIAGPHGPTQRSALLRLAVGDIADGVRSNPEADLKDLIKQARRS